MTAKISTTHLTTILQDTRSRSLELVAGLDEEQLMGPHIATVNPLRWEIGHVAYFYEFFILRQMYGHESLLGAKADKLYDSIAVTHDTRWGLPLLSTSETLSYMRNVLDKLCEHLEQNNEDSMASEQDSFMYQFGVFHEDMHTEAFTCARQILAYPTPGFAIAQDIRKRWQSSHSQLTDATKPTLLITGPGRVNNAEFRRLIDRRDNSPINLAE